MFKLEKYTKTQHIYVMWPFMKKCLRWKDTLKVLANIKKIEFKIVNIVNI